MPQISFTVAVGIRGPIPPGIYTVGSKTIAVSYPAAIDLGSMTFELPKSLSTLFVVSWMDSSGAIAQDLRADSFRRHLPVYEALASISELLLSYKLVRIGHSDGLGLRTVGIGDALFHTVRVDGEPCGVVNVGIKNYEGNNAWPEAVTSVDPHETTKMALPHIGTGTLPIARRYVRCFELLEHGFYSEAFIVSFSILDDFVQQVLQSLLAAKGLSEQSERDELLRGIKENRLKLYLGPLLKLAFGQDLFSMWPDAPKALTWLNSTRNRIAHAAESVDYSAAVKAIYACLRVLVALRENGVANVEIPVELFRTAKLRASWTIGAPSWVPQGPVAESMDFRS